VSSPSEVLKAVVAAGGNISKLEWIAILRSFGRGPRSGNGFFGGVTPSMRSEGDRRNLTEVGSIRAGI
jgi:hypothetical protein